MDSRFRRVDSLTDNQVMWKVRDGEGEKLGVLFERHHQRLFTFFFGLTGSREFSEDLVQEVFLRMLKYRHPTRPGNNNDPAGSGSAGVSPAVFGLRPKTRVCTTRDP